MFISGILRLHLVVEVEQWGALPERNRRGRGFVGGAFGGGRSRRLRSSGHQLQRRHNTSKLTENTAKYQESFCMNNFLSLLVFFRWV